MGYRTLFLLPDKSPPSRGAWIEISLILLAHLTCLSPPSRGAWIEIVHPGIGGGGSNVAPLAGGVD